ncbi:ATP-binding protein [Bradyrhizobium diazoefficiens]|uniref:ATP-binding protein n=1 Tax=Bradyrhizobium diazoefficiens TaxID=1355477 RepID=UPI00190A2A82|nr:ATP-binding protein [Bradyrhizobium diazoefficiens]MBK3664789.1 ATP-binding protein [Bradyrhizobium diazoefficiens]
MSTRSVPPSASALVASLRGVGYSLETAVADLLDNSISAGASNIEIHWDWNDGHPVASLLDDGHGMTETQLVEAMRFGGVGPDVQRGEGDLGRFGLGLKTASLSQCRQLTAISKSKPRNPVTAFTWDIDRIRPSGSGWNLIEGDEEFDGELLPALKRAASGTLIVWRKIDFGRKVDRPDHAAFMADLERLDRHLGMVFHRFLAGDARRLSIRINGKRIDGWDPFLEKHEATIRNPEQPIQGPGGRVLVRGYVLPHRDRFRNSDEFESAGGPEGWTAQQGFYVYRQKRLLSAGGWLGLGGSRTWTRDESSRLARIRVDIPNSADHDWRIDIRKAIARPPDAIRRRLQGLAEDIRRKAREVFVHRGQYAPRTAEGAVSRVWQINPAGSKRRYVIRPEHELIALLKERLSIGNYKLLESLLDLIERTVPVDRVWLDVTEQGVPAEEETDKKELFSAALSMTRLMEKAGMTLHEATARVSAMDPFNKVEHLATQLTQKSSEVRE